MLIQKCTLSDLPTLALLNKQLIEDEQSDNNMTLPELEARMRWFLETEYTAYFFFEEDTVVGYALIKHTAKPLYLRQFLIAREHRRKHYGKQAVELLLQTLQTNTIDIEVYTWNERGIRFWESCGFRPRSLYMRYVQEDEFSENSPL